MPGPLKTVSSTLSSKIKPLLKETAVGRYLLIPYRFKIAASYCRPTAEDFFRWLWTSKEYTNFTFDLNDLNKSYLASFIASITKTKTAQVKSYISEIENDTHLRTHFIEKISKSGARHSTDLSLYYGKRLGWYAFARILKPKIIVETGVDKGFGTTVLAAALLRNRKEGHPGKLYGTDINPQAGYLFGGEYREAGEILYGDSIESLREFDSKIDLFIHDSAHSQIYEENELKTIEDKLSDHALVLSDNSHCSPALMEFAERTQRHFLFFKESPRQHWYPGGGIGVAYGSVLDKK